MSFSTTNISQTTLQSSLTFQEAGITAPDDIVLVGYKETLENDQIFEHIPTLSSTLPTKVDDQMLKIQLQSMVKSIKDSGKATTYLAETRCTTIILPSKKKLSRNNHPLSPHFLSDSLAGIKGDKIQIYVIDKDVGASIGAISSAIARAFPLFNAKSSSKKDENQHISVSLLDGEMKPITEEKLWDGANAVAEGVRFASYLGDMPPDILDTERYREECRQIAEELGPSVEMEEIVGEDLKEKGYGGLYGVGKAAVTPPRMIIMKYTPENVQDDDETIALVGKGMFTLDFQFVTVQTWEVL